MMDIKERNDSEHTDLIKHVFDNGSSLYKQLRTERISLMGPAGPQLTFYLQHTVINKSMMFLYTYLHAFSFSPTRTYVKFKKKILGSDNSRSHVND